MAAAGKEVQTGVSVSLSWSVEYIKEPGYMRMAPKHTVVNWMDRPNGVYSYDDEISINTQSGSQWDGLREWTVARTASRD